MRFELISEEIIRMHDLDIEVRQKLLEEGELDKGYHEKMEEIHLKNAKRLDEIINEIGYPNEEKVGKEASNAAWLIIQHAISLPNFMMKCLKLIEPELQKGNINPLNFVYLKDRISMYQDKPQSYGTQFEIDDNGNLEPYKLDDTTKVINERRRELGLNSIEERKIELRQESEKYNPVKKTKEEIKQEKLKFEEWRYNVGWIKKSRE